MYLLLCGDSDLCEEVSKELLSYFNYRGNPCYTYNYLTPLKEISESAAIAANHYLGKLPSFDQENERKTLERILDSWAEGYLSEAAREHLEDISRRWNELNMFNIILIHGFKVHHILDFPQRYTVYVVREESRPLAHTLFDCAECDVFDQIVDLNERSPQEAANLIGDSLHRKMNSVFDKVQTHTLDDTPHVNGSSV